MSRQFSSAWVVGLLFLGALRLSGQNISSFSPQLGAPGDTITIIGSGFIAGTTKVRFYNNLFAVTNILSGSQIKTIVPVGAVTGPITVQNGAGPINSGGGDFTVIGPGPTITQVTPTYGAVSNSIALFGVHFTGATLVKFNGVNATFSVQGSGTQINAFVPAGASTGPISVTTPLGTSNSPTAFTFVGPGPYITGFLPGLGDVNQSVLITGLHFTGTTAVRFNGTNAPIFSTTTDTSLNATVPNGAMTGPITVVTPAGSYTSTASFYVPPQVTSFAPAAGRVGTNVVIAGRSFTGTTAVRFNGVDATSFTVNSPLQITATVPTNATTGTIRVTSPGGESQPVTNFVVQPLITGFSPTVGIVGQNIGLTGYNFWGTTNVQFNGVNATFSSVTYGSLTATVPPGALNGPITLRSTNGAYTTVNNFNLPASITSFLPTNSAPGTVVTILGNNFSNTTAVKFHDASAGFTVLSNGAISATVPAQVTTGPIAVTTPAGVATSAGNFYAAPVISGFTPTHGVPGNSVTINGTNFLGTSAVRLHGTNIPGFSIVDNGQITFTVPAGAVTGRISVIAPAGTNTSSGDFTLDYSTDLGLTVTDLPDPATLGSNLVYTITITNRGLFAAPNVRLTNTLPAFVTLKSYTTSHGTVNTNANPVVGTLGTIGTGTAAFVTLTVTPQTVGSITNLTTVTSDYPDVNAADNSVTTTTFVDMTAVLAIQSVPPNLVKISWPAPLSNSTLQFKPLLATTNYWSNVTTAPVLSGNENVVTETNLGAMKFYRLQK